MKGKLSDLGVETGRVVMADSRSATHKIVIAGRKSVIAYSKIIGFEHPEKEAKFLRLTAALSKRSYC